MKNLTKRLLAGLLVAFLVVAQVSTIPDVAVMGGTNLTTVGAIPYVSASGTLSQDTPALHWDATNDRMGLGTASPEGALHISAAEPQVRVHNSNTSARSIINLTNTVYSAQISHGGTAYSGLAGNNSLNIYNLAAAPISFGTSGVERMRIGGTGSVGIGPSNTSPSGTLHVYDATATTGVTTLTVRAGAGQSSTNLLSIFANDGTTNRFSVSSAGVGTFASSVSSTGYGHPASAFLINSAAVALGPSVPVTWGPSNYTSADTALSRASANNLAVTNGSSTTYWTLGAGGILAGTDNSIDIGASGANRPRNVFIAGYSLTSGAIYAGSSLNFGSGATSVINGSGTNGNIVISNAAGNDFGRLQFGGTTNLFPAWKRNGALLEARLADDSAGTQIVIGTSTPASAAASGVAGTIAWDANYIYVATGTNTWKRVAIATW